MWELLLVPVTLVVYFLSLVLTFQLGQRHERRNLPNPQTCGCTHDYALHSDRGCRAQVKRTRYDSNGVNRGNEYVLCPCQRFTGELPASILIEQFQPRLPGNTEHGRQGG